MENNYIKLLFLCFAGFALPVAILFIRCPDAPSNFGEIEIINKDSLVHDELQQRSDFYYKQAKATYHTIKKNTDKESDLSEIEKRSVSLVDSLRKLSTQRDAHRLGNADTSLSLLTSLLYIRRDSLNRKIAMRNWPENIIIKVDAYSNIQADTSALLPVNKKRELHLKYIPQATFMGFVSKYPVFGFWVFFTIAQSTIWFLLFSFFSENYRLFTNAEAVKEVVSSTTRDPNTKTIKLLYFRDIGYTALVLILFCVFLYSIIIDSWVIDDHYFLKKYNMRMIIYAFFGYSFAVVCLSVNFPIIRMLDQVKKLIDTSKEEAKKLLVDVNDIFNFAFYTCALVLSLFIIWSSLVVTGINHLEIMSLYKILSGRFYIPVDYVYLIGFIHSLILLIFFIPTYMILKNLVNKITPPPEGENGKSTIQKLLTGLTSSLGVILVTASPFLTSFVQSLIQLIS